MGIAKNKNSIIFFIGLSQNRYKIRRHYYRNPNQDTQLRSLKNKGNSLRSRTIVLYHILLQSDALAQSILIELHTVHPRVFAVFIVNQVQSIRTKLHDDVRRCFVQNCICA